MAPKLLTRKEKLRAGARLTTTVRLYREAAFF